MADIFGSGVLPNLAAGVRMRKPNMCFLCLAALTAQLARLLLGDSVTTRRMVSQYIQADHAMPDWHALCLRGGRRNNRRCQLRSEERRVGEERGTRCGE